GRCVFLSAAGGPAGVHCVCCLRSVSPHVTGAVPGRGGRLNASNLFDLGVGGEAAKERMELTQSLLGLFGRGAAGATSRHSGTQTPGIATAVLLKSIGGVEVVCCRFKVGSRIAKRKSVVVG